ncbi:MULTISPECIES: hypothetical protein [Bacillaceae]|uniref:DOD-type homing endonuclease domain-containing protein n=1 Tax=Evansella alkalicola TaxID=745819 RepID=A0ABS6JRZ7_9BACI|nr:MULTISPECIES: hypothetical protein [Bacillaceae]MBU9721344.1 hypothetical protein [Bacillus alkalicola]
MPLTAEQIDEIRAQSFLNHIDKVWIKENYNVSVRTADRIIKRLGLIHAKQRTIQVIKGYLSGDSTRKLAKTYNMSAQNVRQHLRVRGIKLREARNMYQANFNYFSKIDSEEKAYFSGFVYADGCLTRKGTLTITVSKKDRDILEKFKKAMEAEHPIRHHVAKTRVGDFEVTSFDVTSPILEKDLQKIGVVPCKTLKITFPKNLKKSLYKPFIRGYLDGDGTFGLYKNEQYSLDLEGTVSFLESVREIIQKEVDVPATAKLYGAHKSKNIQRLQLRGKHQVMSVLEWLYQDSKIHLDRKYNRFLKMYNIKK